MDNLFDKIMETIFIDSEFSLIKTLYSDERYKISTSLYIAHKPNSDYFIYINCPERSLPFFSNDIQIKLSSLLKRDLNPMELLNGTPIKISSSFEKNATLIIFTSREELNSNTEKQAISIEEDPYFFKKQVLVVAPHDIDIISKKFNENKEKYTYYLQNLISDVTAFNEFMSSMPLGKSNKATEYYFAAKLYEKLPFLALLVKQSTPDDLQKSIDNELNEEQKNLCKSLLNLDENNLKQWIEEILEEEKNA